MNYCSSFKSFRINAHTQFAISVGSKDLVNFLTEGYYEIEIIDPEGNCIEILA